MYQMSRTIKLTTQSRSPRRNGGAKARDEALAHPSTFAIASEHLGERSHERSLTRVQDAKRPWRGWAFFARKAGEGRTSPTVARASSWPNRLGVSRPLGLPRSAWPALSAS